MLFEFIRAVVDLALEGVERQPGASEQERRFELYIHVGGANLAQRLEPNWFPCPLITFRLSIQASYLCSV